MSFQHSSHDDLNEDPNVLKIVPLFPARQYVLHHGRVWLLRGVVCYGGFTKLVDLLNSDQKQSACCHVFRSIVVSFVG